MYKHLLTVTYMDKHLQKLTYTIVETFTKCGFFNCININLFKGNCMLTFTKRNLHVCKLICTFTMTIRLFVHTSIMNKIASYL